MRIGNLFGVEIYVHVLFLPVAAAVILLGLLPRLWLIYVVIVLHEAAHCLAARLLKVPVRRLEILPFGCAAKIEGALELRPLSEAAIAISGPAANAVLALLAVFLRYYVGLEFDAVLFVQVNLLLCGFNLLPALPLDGGRCLRALLANRPGLKRATGIMAKLTGCIAALALGVGIYLLATGAFNPNPFMIAGLLAFYCMKGIREKQYFQLRSITDNEDILKKSGVMGVRQLAVREDITLNELIDQMLPGRYHLITVVNRGFGFSGQLDERDIMDAYVKYGGGAALSRALRS